MPNVGDIIRAEDIKSGGFIGQIIEFPSNLIPSNTLLCDGSELSRETYSELFNVIGTIYGEGDGSTTFNIPDYRGAFLRCIGGNAAELGVEQGDAIRNISGYWSIRRIDGYADTLDADGNLYTRSNTGNATCLAGSSAYAAHQRVTFDASRVVPTAAENRPINYAVNVCVVYE